MNFVAVTALALLAVSVSSGKKITRTYLCIPDLIWFDLKLLQIVHYTGGKTPAHCACDTCVDYGVKIAPPQLWRDDGRCGAEFPPPNGLPAQCDPFNADEYKCCSPYGWCGKTPAHCACDKCVDYAINYGN